MIRKLNRTTASKPLHRPVKVLQFGSGNFLRGFADWIIDILNEKTDFNGDICVIQSVSSDQTLSDQQGLYHVVTSGIKDNKRFHETRLITSIAGIINANENHSEFFQQGENSELRFVISNTTEAGITFNPDDQFNNLMPSTFPGKLTALLYRRYTFFKGDPAKGLIILPCELIEQNGEILQTTILQYAKHWNLSIGFYDWLINCNTFCNTLVDRIVPGFPKETIDDIQNTTGFTDERVVMAEPYYLWVIDGPEFIQEEFPTKQANLSIIYTNDISSYRERKVRILNGAHTVLVPVAYLKGFRTVREAVENPEIGRFLRNTIEEEIIPTLNQPKKELLKFSNDILERFLNPAIRHQLISISLNSVSKWKVRVLPTLIRFIENKHHLPKGLVLSLAALIRFYKGTTNAESIPLSDSSNILSFFKEQWLQFDHSSDKKYQLKILVRNTLANDSLWGRDLSTISGLEESVLDSLSTLGE